MALRQITYDKLRKKELDNLSIQILNFSCDTYYGEDIYYVMDDLNKKGYVYSNNLDNITKILYGYSDKENEETFLVRLLTLFFLASRIPHNFNGEFCINSTNNCRLNILLNNTKNKIIQYYPEYKITGLNIEFLNRIPQYEPLGTKTIVDNLEDIDIKQSEPIIEILKPGKSDIQLIGYINIISSNIEDTIWKGKLSFELNLNKEDTSIIKHSKKLADKLINNVMSAKGHAGKSSLSVKDIAHNYALLTSLVFKLWNKHITNEN